jgi:uncharacterized membrane protein
MRRTIVRLRFIAESAASGILLYKLLSLKGRVFLVLDRPFKKYFSKIVLFTFQNYSIFCKMVSLFHLIRKTDVQLNWLYDLEPISDFLRKTFLSGYLCLENLNVKTVCKILPRIDQTVFTAISITGPPRTY